MTKEDVKNLCGKALNPTLCENFTKAEIKAQNFLFKVDVKLNKDPAVQNCFHQTQKIGQELKDEANALKLEIANRLGISFQNVQVLYVGDDKYFLLIHWVLSKTGSIWDVTNVPVFEYDDKEGIGTYLLEKKDEQCI